MKVTNLAKRQVATIDALAPIGTAALAMRNNHVGALVVTARKDDYAVPVGIITDRDIVICVVAAGLDPSTITTGDVMRGELLVVHPEDDAYAAIRKMRVLGVRRAPVVTCKGDLVGIFTVDDFIGYLAREISDVSSLIGAEQLEEQSTRFAAQ